MPELLAAAHCRVPLWAVATVLSTHPWCHWSLGHPFRLQVDEPDYDARLGAYAELTEATWAALGPARAPPLLHQCLADLRRAEDLALRHGASQALSRLVAAAAAAASAGDDALPAMPQDAPALVRGSDDAPADQLMLGMDAAGEPSQGGDSAGGAAAIAAVASAGGSRASGVVPALAGASADGEPAAGGEPGGAGGGAGGLPEFVQRVLFAQLKRTVAASSLAVRQVHPLRSLRASAPTCGWTQQALCGP